MTTSLYFLHLTKSTLKRKLLAYFYTNPEARLYLREIALLLGVDPANLSRELKSLVKEGVFLSEKRGLQKFFSLNRTYPLYQELKSIVFKTMGVRGALHERLNHLKGIKRAFLHGSFAKGTENASSDIDLCVIVDKDKFDETAFLSSIQDLERELAREINYVYYPQEEWEKKVSSQDSFVQTILKNKRIELIHGKD